MRIFGGGYDLALIRIFCIINPAVCTTFLKKVHASLVREEVAIVEFVPNPDGLSPPMPAASA